MATLERGVHGTAMRHIGSQPWPRRAVPGWGEFLIVELTSDGKAMQVMAKRCVAEHYSAQFGVAAHSDTGQFAAAGHPIGIDSSRRGVK